MLHHFERKRSTALRSGWRMSTSGAATAPLCLNRKARFVPRADSSAQMSPTPTDSETLVTAGPSSARSQDARALPPKWGPSFAIHVTPPYVRASVRRFAASFNAALSRIRLCDCDEVRGRGDRPGVPVAGPSRNRRARVRRRSASSCGAHALGRRAVVEGTGGAAAGGGAVRLSGSAAARSRSERAGSPPYVGAGPRWRPRTTVGRARARLDR
jgi:hypothetical protein